MAMRRLICISSTLLILSALGLSVPGCGGGQETNPDGSVKVAPPLNPAPGSLEPEKSVPPGKR